MESLMLIKKGIKTIVRQQKLEFKRNDIKKFS
jgi:hypothetical protein